MLPKNIIIVIVLLIALVSSIGINVYQSISLKNSNEYNNSEIKRLKDKEIASEIINTKNTKFWCEIYLYK